MNLKFIYLAIITILTFTMSCNLSQDKKIEKSIENTHHEAKKDCKDLHWSHHKGEHGPANWANMCTGFSACGGQSQSPINIISNNTVADTKMASPRFNYGTSKVDIINNGHTVQFNIDGKNEVNLNGNDYKLLQFHFHALSEHTIDGKHFPLEVHFVHKHSDTDYAVLGAMFVEGKENPLFAKYLENFPTSKGLYKSDDMIDILNILPKNKSYYHYNGSLTTPPCSEVVSWYILKNPIEASKTQIAQFSKILNQNYRPTKSLNKREIQLFSE